MNNLENNKINQPTILKLMINYSKNCMKKKKNLKIKKDKFLE